ncbi:MAG: hypothetical protein ACXWJN_03915 [Methyloceanibacter sp.]
MSIAGGLWLLRSDPGLLEERLRPFRVGAPLLLGSWLGLILSLIMIVMLAIRAVLEERTLTAEPSATPTTPTACAIDSCRVFGKAPVAG